MVSFWILNFHRKQIKDELPQKIDDIHPMHFVLRNSSNNAQELSCYNSFFGAEPEWDESPI